MLKRGTFVVLACLVAGLLAASSADAAQECFGKRATVAGTVGTTGDDVIIGTSAGETIDGLGGNDRICGLGGDDLIHGGDGNDKISGGDGADVLIGDNEGSGTVSGVPGNDTLIAGTGPYIGSLGIQLMVGDNRSNNTAIGGGNDIVKSNGGTAIVVGDSMAPLTAIGGGDDTITGGSTTVGDSLVYTTAAGPYAVSGSGSDKISKTIGGVTGDSAVITSVAGQNATASDLGGSGNDVIRPKLGGTLIVGDHYINATGTISATGGGVDTINAKNRTDAFTIDGDNSDGTPLGMDGDDDTITGSDGGDTIFGGPGSDFIDGRKGFDACDGGADTDTAHHCEMTSNVEIT